MPMDRFGELKARQAASWGAAPFERVTETFADFHDRLIARLASRPGETWLDVATGTGPLALRAARAGATVVGVDLAPSLIATACQLAAAAGLAIPFEVGDCERLAHRAASFDVVVSSFGTIFAPDHAAVVAELARVCRPGGKLGLAGWRPGGGAARMAEVVMSFQASPPVPGVGNPFDWGREEYVGSRLDDAFELEFVAGDSPQVAPSAESVWDLYVTSAGPVKALASALPPDRRDALRRAFVSLVDRHRDQNGIRFPREYLLVLGRRR
jgi:SAM-dependent methyltransferase